MIHLRAKQRKKNAYDRSFIILKQRHLVGIRADHVGVWQSLHCHWIELLDRSTCYRVIQLYHVSALIDPRIIVLPACKIGTAMAIGVFYLPFVWRIHCCQIWFHARAKPSLVCADEVLKWNPVCTWQSLPFKWKRSHTMVQQCETVGVTFLGRRFSVCVSISANGSRCVGPFEGGFI